MAGVDGALENNVLRRRAFVSGGNAGKWRSSAGTSLLDSEWRILPVKAARLAEHSAIKPRSELRNCGAFFGIYAESGDVKAVRIFNPTQRAVNLSNYTLVRFTNGADPVNYKLGPGTPKVLGGGGEKN